MPENNQASDKTKPEATGSSSTQPGSQAIDMNHTNVIVPHRISNHDKLVQTMVMVDGEWVNVNDTNDQKNVQEDMHKVNRVVTEAQKDIINAQNAADSAVKSADSAISASKVNSDAIAAQGEAISEAKIALDSAAAEIQLTASNAASDAAKIRADVAQMQSEVDTAKAANSATVEALKSDVSAAKQDIQAARQANENVAKQLDDYTKQAQAQGKTIKDIQNAQDGYTATLADVKGNVSKISDAVDGLSASLKDDQDNVATIKAKADELSATLTDHDKNIAQLTASAKELSSTLEDADGRLSKVEQTAATLTNEFADQQGHLNRVEQTAQGTEQTVANQQGQINTIKTDATGIHETLTGQGNQIANINATLNGLNSKYEGVSGDLGKLKSQAQWITVTSAVDLNNVKTPCHEFLEGTVTNAPNEAAWWYLTVEGSYSGRITQTVIADQSNNCYTRRWAGSWSAWVRDATQTDVTALSNRITTNSTQITQNKKEIDLKADQSTVDNLSGEVSQNKAQLQVQADQISSKVSSEDFNTLDNKVNGMKIGTRNLLHNTSDQWRTLTNDGGWLQKTTASSALTPTDDYHGGDEFTYTAKITNNSHQQAELEVWLFDQNKSWIYGQSFHAPIPKGANAYDAHVTFPITASTSYIRSWIIFTGGHAPHGDQIQVKDERLVRGNLAGTWETNPDDTIDSIKKNTTAINQTNKQISLKADQTEVDKVKQTATQNSSRLDVMAGEIKSKVTSTDVNNIVNSKGYATTSTVQSLITQKAGTINESITNLTNEMNTRNGVNLLKGTRDFSGAWQTFDKGNHWFAENWIDPNGNHSVKSNAISWTGYYQPIYLDTGDYTFSGYYYSEGGKPVFCYIRPYYGDNLVEVSYNKNLGSTPNGWRWFVVHFKVTKAGNAAVRLESGQNQILHIASYKLERGTVANPVWTPAPSDNATVTQVQQITASIDGLQSTVASKADRSQITQLSDVIQSKVSSTDFNNLRKAVDLQTLESADANNLKTNGHYFVHNLANNPVGGWVYVDVTGNGNDRIRQDVYQDSGNKHKYRRWFGNSWTNWSEGATESEITQLRDDINLRVKSGDLLSQINIEAGRTLIQSNKIYFDADSFVMSPNSKAFIPSAFITNLSADKITTGTLDASKLHVKNFSANDIEAGTLSGVTIKAGDTDFFQTSQDNIYWITNNGRQSALIGRGEYVTFPGLNIFDSNAIHLGTWAGADLENGTIKDTGGSLGHPKFNIELPADSAFDLLSKNGEMGSTMVPLDNSRISGWVGQREFFFLKQTQGFHTELNPDLNTSQFRIQKDDHIGAYFGEGNNGNQITFNFGGNDGGLNVNGPLHVTGSKNSIVETRQGYLAINAYETAEYYFGDIGENNTGDTSQVVIGIDRIFNEVVNTDIQYQVFVTPYSNAHVWVEKRYNNRFIVKSDRPNAEFGWELKAKRKGYESNRLRRVNVDFNQMDLKGEN